MPVKKILAKRLLKVEYPSEDGRFYILVKGSDGKQYQVKFNAHDTRGNQNEFIANSIGKEMDAPVLDGALIMFTKRQLDGIANRVTSNFGVIPDIAAFKERTLFGIEWHDGAITPFSDAQIPKLLENCANKDAFYAIFAYDQYLRNYDRQHFNHLVLKRDREKKPRMYAAIDGDRIFGSTGWSKIDEEMHLFDCFSEPFHKMLYNLVDDSSFTKVFRYAAAIDMLPDAHIDDIIDIMRAIYANTKRELDKIEQFLKYRRLKMTSICNGACFPKVRHKRLKDDESSYNRRYTNIV